MKASGDGVYEDYAAGRMTSDEYRKKADELRMQADRLSEQLNEWQEKFLILEEEQEKIETDMKQIIRYSHMEELTQELVDTFVERIYAFKDKRVEIEWKFGETT